MKYFTPYGLSLIEAVRANAPTIWADYFDPYMGNALIPCEDMTPTIWDEVARLLEAVPYYSRPNTPNGFALIHYQGEDPEGNACPFWCLTSSLE